MPRNSKQRSSLFPDRLKNSIALSFWALFFFLCASDRVFGFQFHGLHFRWGQFLLLGAALFALPRSIEAFKKSTADRSLEKKILSAWLPFFILYALAAALSTHPGTGFLKLGWGIFNILGAGLVVLGFRGSGNLTKGFLLALTSIALVLWVDSFFLQCLGRDPLIGYAQSASGYQVLFRPSAFYFEPSYAGSALAFSFPLLMAAFAWKKGWKPILVGAILFGSVVLTGSRTGILCLLSAVSIALALAAWKKKKDLLLWTGKVLAAALFLLFLFFITPGGWKYGNFLWRGLGPSRIVQNISSNPEPTSESARLKEIGGALETWKEHPWLGSGVVPNHEDPQNPLLKPVATSVWVELAVESGLLGFLAFALAVGLTMKAALERNLLGAASVFIFAAWAAHFVVNLNFTQTFPRLDFWLLFFFSIRLLTTAGVKERSR